MKIRERIKRMNATRVRHELVALAEDTFPGTEFDDTFRCLAQAWLWEHGAEQNFKSRMSGAFGELSVMNPHANFPKMSKGIAHNCKAEATEICSFYGRDLADVCVEGDSQALRDMADAIDVWKKHKPSQDLRATLLSVCSPVDREWARKYLAKIAANDRRKGFEISDERRAILQKITAPHTMRDILAKLKERGRSRDDPRWVRTLCRELGIKIEGKPGKPKAK